LTNNLKANHNNFNKAIQSMLLTGHVSFMRYKLSRL